MGPAEASGIKVAGGLAGSGRDTVLLGQSFLSRFEIRLTGEQMVLRKP